MYDQFRYLGTEKNNEDNEKPRYKPKIDVVETVTYNIDGTWGHTRPGEKIIVMLPIGFRDYNFPIFAHEVLHNFRPGWSEEAVRRAAYNPVLAKQAVDSFEYSYRKA